MSDIENFDPAFHNRSIEDIKESSGIQNTELIKSLAENNYEFFLEHVLGLNVESELIQEAVKLVQNPPEQPQNNGTKIAVMAPRGHSKTYSFTIGQALWIAYTESSKRIILTSASRGQSKGILNTIKRIIERNELLHFLKPSKENREQLAASMDLADDEGAWAAKSIVTTSDVAMVTKTFGSSIRSEHVDYVFCDDILTDEKSGSMSKQDEKNTFYEVISPIAENKDGLIQVVGTPQSHNDLLMELVDKDAYYGTRYQAYDTDTKEPLWPFNWTYDKLMNKKEEVGPARFAREYMCIEEGTPIQMKDGWKAIEDIEPGDEVLTHKGNYKEVLQTFENGKDEIYNVYTPGYSGSVGMTAEHPVLTEKGWIEASELDNNNYVLTPRMYGEKKLSDGLATIFGWYVAEGSIGANGRQVRFCLHEDETEELHNALVKEGYDPKYYGGKTERVEPITVNSKELADELESKFGRAKDKHVWSGIHEHDLNTQERFLRAYLSGDGHTQREGVHESRSVCLKVSEAMARIATALGWTITRDYENKPVNPNPDFGREKECEASNWHRVRYYENESKRAKLTNEHVAYPVDSVIKNGRSKVYNIEVEGDNSYHLPMFAVHNCNPMSVEEQFFSWEEAVKPNLDSRFKQDHWKAKIGDDYDDWQFFLGVDIALSNASGADYTVLQVLGQDPQGQTWHCDIRREKGLTPPQIADMIVELDQKYRFDNGLVEKNAIGEGVWDTIKERASLSGRIKSFDTTRKTRPEILSRLQAALYSNKIVLHDYEPMMDELLSFYKNESGKLEGKAHDDCVMALAIAWRAAGPGDHAPTSMTVITGDGDEIEIGGDGEEKIDRVKMDGDDLDGVGVV